MLRQCSLVAGLSMALTSACNPLAAPVAAASDEGIAPWSFCPLAPSAPSAIDPTRLWLQFSPDALYCSLEQSRDVDDRSAYAQLDEKRQLRLVAGDNFLPMGDGTHEHALALCVLGANNENVLGQDFRGEWRVERSTQVNGERVRYRYVHKGFSPDGDMANASLELRGYAHDLVGGVRLDGETWPAQDPSLLLALDEEARRTTFDACRLDEAIATHVVSFEGGQLELSLQIDDEWPGWLRPKRARLLAATGFVEGIAVSQESFWHLGVREAWPGSSVLDVAVRFSEPAGASCGLSLLLPTSPSPEASGAVIKEKCDGSREQVPLTSHMLR
ncbi:MAG: hypothetical protein ACO3JL_05265 [Myxococcota bacterium]